MRNIDIITKLTHRKTAIVAAKANIMRDAEAQCRKLDAELRSISKAIETINSAAQPFLCKSCGGSGEESYTDGAGSKDTKPCSACGGTGVRV